MLDIAISNEILMLRFSLQGCEFVLRDLCKEDADKYLTFFNGLSVEAIRCRFGHQLAKLTLATAEQRVSASGEGERALAVFDKGEEQILAIGRCFYESEDSEIAVVVADSARRLGVGGFVLHQLIQVAEENGCRSVHAYIGTENAPVIKMLRAAGFVAQRREPGEDLQLTLSLEGSKDVRRNGIPSARA